jgi:aldose 1-epimerase
MGPPPLRPALHRASLVLGAVLLPLSPPMAARIAQSRFGTMPDGTPVAQYTLTNAHGLVCKAITYGAAITELETPDRAGRMGDVVLGFDNLPQYLTDSPCFGAVCGRVANRISQGRFTLDGKTYALALNNPPNTLHGGFRGFDKVVWEAEAAETPDGPAIVFRHVSPDGDQGFPGMLAVRMTYTLTNGNELRIDYEATTDRPTPLNLTNHSYFNLAGSGDILGHVLQVKARKYTVTDADLIPTGEIADVAGSPLDFSQPKPVGQDILRLSGKLPGYDNNYVIDGGGPGPVLAAKVYEPSSGRTMEVSTDQPGIQVYTSNSFNGTLVGKRGAAFPLHAGLCLETQHFADSVNQPSFPSTILRPGETFRSTTLYRFGAR